ncbi:transposase [Streptomyces sp. HB2AG]|uniref:transposase n=1 Tax=Streptomyces sp. HB2AG TaxID=2983400 RepID=UPI003FA760AD
MTSCAFPERRPGISPTQVAMVCVLQFLLVLSDRQAVEAVRCRIDFTYALAMDLDDPGFHHSVFTEGFPTSCERGVAGVTERRSSWGMGCRPRATFSTRSFACLFTRSNWICPLPHCGCCNESRPRGGAGSGPADGG